MVVAIKNSSLIEQLRLFWESVTQLSADGPNLADLSSLLQVLDVNFTTFLQSDFKIRKRMVRKFAIVEFLHKNRLKILLTKLNTVKENTLSMKLLAILEALLIGAEKDCLPFWTESSKEISKKLWLPTKIDSVDLDSNSYPICLTNIKSSSWFSIKYQNQKLKNSPTTSPQLLPFFPPDSTGPENIMISRKVKIFLSGAQKHEFLKWLGTCRYSYNLAIDELNNSYKTGKLISKYDLRTKLVTELPKELEWLALTPQGMREGAVFDAYDAFMTNLKSGKKFQMKYRSRKARSQSCLLPVDSLKIGMKLYPKILKHLSHIKIHPTEEKHFSWRVKQIKDLKKMAEAVDKKKIIMKTCGQILESPIRIQKTRTGHWYLCIPSETHEIVPENQGNLKLVSLDPGVRTFLTGYCPDGELIKIGDNDINRIRNYCLKTDKFISKIGKMKGKKKYRCQKAKLKRFEKVRHTILDCHRKVVRYVVDNFDVIILPLFQTSAMSKRGNRKIHSKTVRNMLTWAHYKFRMMLADDLRKYPHKRLILTTEEYTSKTCPCCGYVKMNLGGNKTFKCDKCKTIIDRDVNGSRNILIKYLTEKC